MGPGSYDGAWLVDEDHHSSGLVLCSLAPQGLTASVASMNGTWWILKLGDDNQQSTLVPLVCSLVIIILIIIIIVIVIIVIFYVHAGMIVIAFFYSYRMDDR